MKNNAAAFRNVIRPYPESARRAVAVISIVLIGLALAPARATAQQIVKWTDDQGQVHYSDHAPPGQAAVDVNIPKAPKVTLPTNAGIASSPLATSGGNSGGSSHSPGSPQTASSNEDPRAVAAREQERKWEEQRKAAAAASAQADKETLERCQADRETYCRDGVAAIRQHEKLQAEQQYLNAVEQHEALANRGIHTPVPQPPPSLTNSSSYPTPTNKLCQKKDCSHGISLP